MPPKRSWQNTIPPWPFAINRESPQSCGLVGWWPMANDRGGQSARDLVTGMHGALAGAATWTTTNQFFGVDLDGNTGTYVEVLGVASGIDRFSFGTGAGGTDSPFSWSAWIKPRGVDITNNTIACKWDKTGSDYEYWLFFDGNDKLVWKLYHPSSSTTRIGLISTSAYTTLTGWHHVVGTYDASKVYTGLVLYVDGVPIAVGSGANGAYTGMGPTTAPLRFGARRDAVEVSFDGVLADLRCYNYELTAEQVWQMYDPRTRCELYLPQRRRVTMATSAGGPTVMPAWYYSRNKLRRAC